MPKIHETAWIAPGAIVRGGVTIAEGASIWYNAVLRADHIKISVGKDSNIQDCCVLHGDAGHDIVIGERVSVGHNAVLHGCTVEDDCIIGMGAVVLDLATIGKGSLVGAGSVVSSGTKIPPNSLVVGTPAKVKRQLTPEDVQHNLQNAAEYSVLMREARLEEG